MPISEELGVSRGPVREALRSLESEGLVEITPRRGAVVTSLSKRDFLEAYQVRESLEALGVRLAVPRLTDGALDALDDRLDQMTEYAATGDVDAFFEANAGFHEAFMDASENRKLIEIYRRLMAQMGPYRRPSAQLRGNFERSITEHREITRRRPRARCRGGRGAPDAPCRGAPAPARRHDRRGIHSPDLDAASPVELKGPRESPRTRCRPRQVVAASRSVAGGITRRSHGQGVATTRPLLSGGPWPCCGWRSVARFGGEGSHGHAARLTLR